MVRIVLTIRFDAAMDAAVRERWQRLADAGIPVPGISGHRPHISLVDYHTEDIAEVQRVLEQALTGVKRFPLNLKGFGIFPEAGVLYLNPQLTGALFGLHDTLLRRFAELGYPEVGHPFSERDIWTPHCTLSVNLTPAQISESVNLLLPGFTPITGWAEAVGLFVLDDVEREDRSEVLLE